MSYASELLDGFNEALAEFGTTITPSGSSTPVAVLAVGPEKSIEMMMAGNQQRGSFNFQVARTAAEAVGMGSELVFRFTAAGSAIVYEILPIEDDPGLPILYVSADVVP